MAGDKPTNQNNVNSPIKLMQSPDPSHYDPAEYFRSNLAGKKYNKEYDQLSKKQKQDIERMVAERLKIVETFRQENEYQKENLKVLREQYEVALKINKAALATAQSEEERKVLEEERYAFSHNYYALKTKELQEQEKLLQAQREEKKLAEETARVHFENASRKEKEELKEQERNEKAKKQKETLAKIEKNIAQARLAGDEKNASMWQSVYEKVKKRGEEQPNLSSALKTDLKGLFSKEGLKDLGSGVMEGVTSGKGLSSAVGSALKGSASNFVGAFAASPWAKLALEGIKLIASGVGALQKQLDKGVEEAIKVQTSYLGKINSRLMGSSESFAKFQNDLGASFGKSAFISQQNLMKTIADMVEKGIAFNVEQRAIFQELKDSMVSTFDSFAGELPRLIRLQQTDMTAGQMGYQALLTQFLNKNFQDTSYLGSVYDSISASLIDAASQLTAEGAAEFNFAVQKWLGSLYSVGMSQEGVSRIAKGIEYLATGNVEALNSDDGLRTLFASAAGSAYSQILTGGLNAATVNDLLSNVVVYLKGISKDTNQVTKQALAGAFGGLSFGDLRALNNMSDSIVASIRETSKSYGEAMTETYNQLMHATTVYNYKDFSTDARVSPAQLFETAYQNVLYEYGVGVASDFKSYNTFRIASQLEDAGKLGKIAGGIVKFVSNIISDIKGDKQGGIESLFNMIDVEFSNADRYKNLFLNSDMISSLISDLKKNRVVTRGDAATLASLADTNTLTGFSVMSRLNLAPGGEGITDFSTNTATAAQTTTTGEVISRDVSDLYAELFERQTTSMKVSLDAIGGTAVYTLSNIIDSNTKSSVGIQNIGEEALKSLSQAMKTDVLESIDEKLSGTIQVSGQEDFVSAINNGLAYARGI